MPIKKREQEALPVVTRDMIRSVPLSEACDMACPGRPELARLLEDVLRPPVPTYWDRLKQDVLASVPKAGKREKKKAAK